MSMISTESRMISGLRRTSTPTAPIDEQHRRQHHVPGDAHAAGPPSSRPPRPSSRPSRAQEPERREDVLVLVLADPSSAAGEYDPADGGDQEHDRGDLEGDQMVGQEQVADRGGRAERVGFAVGGGERRAVVPERHRPVPSSAISSSTSTAAQHGAEPRSPEATGPRRQGESPAGVRRSSPPRRPGRRSRTGTCTITAPPYTSTCAAATNSPAAAGRARRARRGCRSAPAPRRTGCEQRPRRRARGREGGAIHTHQTRKLATLRVGLVVRDRRVVEVASATGTRLIGSASSMSLV